MRSIFARLDQKHKLLGDFEKYFEKFQMFPSENCKECITLAYFF